MTDFCMLVHIFDISAPLFPQKYFDAGITNRWVMGIQDNMNFKGGGGRQQNTNT